MPKIDISLDLLSSCLGKEYSIEAIEPMLPAAKAELDSIDRKSRTAKIEFNDTNRPDLWSAAGLARQLKSYIESNPITYGFFSRGTKNGCSDAPRIHVDESMQQIRPYIAAFIANGPPVDSLMRLALIQTQEKLCTNYGRKRKTVAMGIYSGERIKFPVYYSGADPVSATFVPLDSECSMSLMEILSCHPKGREYGHIIAGSDLFPFLQDSKGECLSMPPIINSNTCGAVGVGDRKLFAELTGMDMDSVLTAASIIACDMSDMGFEICPVEIAYPYNTPYGRRMTTPFHFQGSCSVEMPAIRKTLGEDLAPETVMASLCKMGHQAEIENETVTISVPPFRNDFMHGVDIIEEIMSGIGLESFAPASLADFTIGRLSPTEELSRDIREIMVGLGYQEMLYNYLGSADDLIHKMIGDGKQIIEIENPMTESYQMVRNSVLPNLLNSTSVSRNASYPHKLFEIGNTAVKNARIGTESETKTHQSIGILYSDAAVTFNEINAHVAALTYFLSLDVHIDAVEDARFITGRCVGIYRGKKRIGIMGEIHPSVLENWHIEMPCAAAELTIAEIA